MTPVYVSDSLAAQAATEGIALSVKGVLLAGRNVLLLRNPRQELELPGGRPDAGETFEQVLRREVLEETGLRIEVGDFIDTWIYVIPGEGRVRIVTFKVTLENEETRDSLRLSPEHLDAQWCDITRLPAAVLPKGYRNSIRLASEMR